MGRGDVKKEVYIGLRVKLLHFHKSGNTSGREKRLGRGRKSLVESMFCISKLKYFMFYSSFLFLFSYLLSFTS